MKYFENILGKNTFKLYKKYIQIIQKIHSNYTKNTFVSIIIYFSLLFIIDYSGIMNLYDQNYVRRVINMYRRRDPLTYKNKLRPFCEPAKKMLNAHDIKELQSIKIPNATDVSVISRKNTTTHQCCEKFSEEEKEIIQRISEKVKQKYEKIIGKKLYYLGTNKATIYVYHGKNSQHLWHVDPQNLFEIYNVIVCIKKIGEISPLQCKNEKDEISSIHFEEGDAAIFNGGTTVHQVPPNDDDNSERTVLSIAFTSDNSMNDDDKYSNNMCTYSEGGNNYFNMFKLFLATVIINLIISFISGIQIVSYTFLLVIFIIVLFIVKYFPFLNTGLGSGRSSSIINNLILLPAVLFLTLSIKGGLLFYIYFLLSDVFFSRSWVEYD